MRRYLRERGGGGGDIPLVVQANKQDSPGAMTPTELGTALRVPKASPVLGAVATKDTGVRECFNFAVKSAVRAAQLHVSAHGLHSITSTVDTADSLLDAILAMEDLVEAGDLGEDEPTEEELGAAPPA
jgi:hypothetical protein